jgi:hypothetical protein
MHEAMNSMTPRALQRADLTVRRGPDPGLQPRWGAQRPVIEFIGMVDGVDVGVIWVVAEPDPLAGLVAWVHVPRLEHRGRGYGLALHRAAAWSIGGRLLLDTIALGTHVAYDGVSTDELRVWDRMVCSPTAWYVRFAAGGQVIVADLVP